MSTNTEQTSYDRRRGVLSIAELRNKEIADFTASLVNEIKEAEVVMTVLDELADWLSPDEEEQLIEDYPELDCSSRECTRCFSNG